MRPKASILILLTFAPLMVLSFVALGCPGVDYIRLWPLPVEQPWQETPDPLPDLWPGSYAMKPMPTPTLPLKGSS
jgi:hypothetical protein